MTLSQPWGLLALSSIGIVILIHLFQRRFRKRRITGLFLWHEGPRHALSGKTVQPPPPTISLLLEILACILLSLLLAGAGCEMKTHSKHIVFVLDSSGSMNATSSTGESFRERAEGAVKKILKKENNERVTFITTGPAPVFLFGPEGDPAMCDKAFLKWKCLEYNHDIFSALTLAKNIEGIAGETIVISDTLPSSTPPSIGWIGVGESRSNTVFTSAYRISKGDGQDLVRLSLKRFGEHHAINITVRDGDNILLEKKVSPGDPQEFSFLVPKETGTLEAVIPEDALALDNRVLLPPPPHKQVRFMNLFKGMEKEILDRVLLCINGTVPVDSAPADLYAGPGTEVLKAPGDAWILAFAPFPEEMMSGTETAESRTEDTKPETETEMATTFLGPYTTDSLHPLLSSVSFKGVAWHSPGILNTDSFPIASCGNRAIVVDAPPPHSGFLFNLDLSRTNLFRTKTWPVLFYNIIESVKNTLPGPDRTNFPAGIALTLKLPGFKSDKVTVEGEDWLREIDYRKEIFLTLPSNTMELEIKDGNNKLFSIATNWIDTEESDLTNLDSGEVKVKKEIQPRKNKAASDWSNPLFQILIWLLAATLFANWFITQKRGNT